MGWSKLGNQNKKWWLSKPCIVATHTKPDEDVIVSVTLLKLSGAKIKGYWFRGEGDESLPPQINFRDIVWIDRGRQVFDHHGIKGKTSAQIVAEELEIANEKWLRPILAHVQRADLEGRSEPMDLNEMTKAIARECSDDSMIMELGIRIATALVEFHRNNLKRNNQKASEILKESFGEKMPERIRHYYQLLQNPNFNRVCDFAELATVDPELAKEVLKFVSADIQKYERAKEELEKAQKIRVGRYLIIVGTSNNPKFNVAARAAEAAIVIQQNTDKHVQIFFNNKVLKPQIIEEISEDLIEALRLREISLDPSRKLPVRKSDLRSVGKIPEVPEWYWFKGERGGCLLLNGSLTSPDVPPTKIPLEEIAEIVNDALRTHLEQMGRGTARRGAPPQKPRREGFGDKALGHQ